MRCRPPSALGGSGGSPQAADVGTSVVAPPCGDVGATAAGAGACGSGGDDGAAVGGVVGALPGAPGASATEVGEHTAGDVGNRSPTSSSPSARAKESRRGALPARGAEDELAAATGPGT